MRQHDERDMVMPADPATAFVMIQAELVLQLLVVLLNRPAALGHAHQAAQGGARRQIAQPVLGGGSLRRRPFRQQPDRLVRGLALDEPMRRLHPEGQEARRQPPRRRGATEWSSNPVAVATTSCAAIGRWVPYAVRVGGWPRPR